MSPSLRNRSCNRPLQLQVVVPKGAFTDDSQMDASMRHHAMPMDACSHLFGHLGQLAKQIGALQITPHIDKNDESTYKADRRSSSSMSSLKRCSYSVSAN